MKRLEELWLRFEQEPLVHLLGARLEALEDGQAVIALTARQELTIVGGVAQGGVTTALADYAGVYAAMTRIPSGHVPAVDISIKLFRPVVLGETIKAAARVINDSRSQIVTQVEVHGQDGKLKAVATISFAKPSR